MTLMTQSFEKSNGFSALTADELYFVNGGSSFSGGMAGNSSGGGPSCATGNMNPSMPSASECITVASLATSVTGIAIAGKVAVDSAIGLGLSLAGYAAATSEANSTGSGGGGGGGGGK